jgi:hypothetical protein
MSHGSYIDDRLWCAILPDLVLNPDAAIYTPGFMKHVQVPQ